MVLGEVVLEQRRQLRTLEPRAEGVTLAVVALLWRRARDVGASIKCSCELYPRLRVVGD